MTRKTKNRIWILLLVVGLACLGFYVVSQWRQEQEARHPAETKALLKDQQATVEERKEAIEETGIEEEASHEAFPEKDPCAQMEERVADFFRYLDDKTYVRQIDLETDTYTRFKEILSGLSARPPVPAGEGMDPEIIIQNICHFFRVLNSKDLRLIKETIRNEQDSLEIDIEMFYQWLMLGDRCPSPEGLRPSLEVLYRYAGFFINTIGGRAYLFRRTSSLRLLVTYYCILIIHEADKTGKNTYGIDIPPHIGWLRQEITRNPDLKFQQYYIDQLNLIESYYVLKRPQDL